MFFKKDSPDFMLKIKDGEEFREAVLKYLPSYGNGRTFTNLRDAFKYASDRVFGNMVVTTRSRVIEVNHEVNRWYGFLEGRVKSFTFGISHYDSAMFALKTLLQHDDRDHNLLVEFDVPSPFLNSGRKSRKASNY